MADWDRHAFDVRNLDAKVGEPSVLQDSSVDQGWRTALLRTYRCIGDSDPFEIAPSDDQKIVVNLSGHEELRCLTGGLWRSGIKQTGSVGMTPPGEGSRLQWHSLDRDGFTTAHLYVPGTLFEESWEEQRRAGSAVSDRRLNTLAFDDGMVAAIVRDLVRGLRSGAGELFAEERLRLLVGWLTSETRDLEGDADRDPGVLGERRLQRALEFMTFDLSVTHGLDAIAKAAGISVFHFARMFRQATGKPPFAFLTDVRLDVARTMLERSDVPVGEVGRRVGYPVPRNFSAAFSRRYGLNPAAWRQQRRTAAIILT